MMRTAPALLALSALSCGAVSFEVDQDLQEQTVPGSALPSVLSTFLSSPFKFSIDINAEVAKHGTGPATSAALESLSLSITPHNAPMGNFDFLQEVHLFVEADGLAKVEVANILVVPKGSVVINFTILPGINLLPYIQAGANISATAVGTQPSQDTSFDGHVTALVHI